MATKDEVIEKVREILSEYSADINFSRGSDLARRGEYSEAEFLLLPNGKIPERAKELDLLAKISANKGDCEAAIKYWNLAIQGEPGNQNFKDSLSLMEKTITEGRSLKVSAPHLFLYAIILTMICLIIIILFRECANYV